MQEYACRGKIFKNFLLYYFPLSFSLLILPLAAPPSGHNHQSVVCVREFFFLFGSGGGGIEQKDIFKAFPDVKLFYEYGHMMI